MTRKLICSLLALGLASVSLSSPSYALQCDSCPPEFGGTRVPPPPPPGHDKLGDDGQKEPDRTPGPKNPRKEKEAEKKADEAGRKAEKKPAYRYEPGQAMRAKKCIRPLNANC